MRRIHKLTALLLPVLLTVCIIVLPQIISKQQEQALLSQTTYRQYTVGNRTPLTKPQVALLYYNRNVDMGNAAFIHSATAGETQIRENVLEMIAPLFPQGTPIQAEIQQAVENGEVSYARNSNLVKIDNQPTALNFVHWGVSTPQMVFSVTYEEKTQTIIHLSCDIPQMAVDDVKQATLALENTVPSIESYYEKQLSLSSDKYYCTTDVSKFFTDAKDNRYAGVYIRCGVLQYEHKDVGEEQTIIYN